MSTPGWQQELGERFAARADPTLRREDLHALAALAGECLDEPTGYDIDLIDLLRYSVAYANNTSESVTDLESRARRTAGAAFLHAGWTPNLADVDLIGKGNGAKYTGDPSSKLARDTWSYLVYKRLLGDNRRGFYSYKPGAALRDTFCDALIEAVQTATAAGDTFRLFCREQRQAEREQYAINYTDSRPGLGSTGTKLDRADARDVNFPDGTLVPLGVKFTKTWEVKNIGEIPWIGRRLTRLTPQGPTFPSSSEWIPIPDTFPAQTIQLSVDFVAGRVQGFSTVRFKMTDQQGNLYFPGKYPYGLTLLIETGGFEWIERRLP